MKVLSLKQPWATLIAIGAKRIETRSWNTRYHGPLAIHASKSMTLDELDFCYNETVYRVLYDAGIVPSVWPTESKMLSLLPLGQIIATCYLVDCRPIGKYGPSNGFDFRTDTEYVPQMTPEEKKFGNYQPGRYALFLDDITKLEKPIPAKGALGLWQWDPPEEVIREEVRRRDL